jgi:excisionase family DNA binding protein
VTRATTHNTRPDPRLQPTPVSGLATIADACRFLAMSRTLCYRLMKEEQLPYTLVGAVRRIPWRALHRWTE